MFAGPINTGAALLVKSWCTHISGYVRDIDLSHKTDHLTYFLKNPNLNGHENFIINSTVMAILLNWCKD